MEDVAAAAQREGRGETKIIITFSERRLIRGILLFVESRINAMGTANVRGLNRL